MKSPAAEQGSRNAVHIALLATVAVYFLVWPIWRAGFLIEIWPTEAWNAYFQDAAASGRPLYPDPTSLIGNNYPPLSFYAIGLLGKLTGVDNLFVGRLVSLVGLTAIAVEVLLAVRILTSSTSSGVIAALWYLAIKAHNSTTYIGTNDPQLAGHAIMGAALVWFLARDRDRGSLTAPLLLMVVGGFWKHNMIAVPITAIAWAFATRGREAARPVIASAVATFAGLALCVAVYPGFVENMLALRHYGWSNVMNHIGHLQWVGLAVVFWAMWAWSDRRSRQARFTFVYIAVALVTCILQWFGHGVRGNAEFDLIMAAAIGIGCTLAGIQSTSLAKRTSPGVARDIVIAVLLLRLLGSDRQETALLFLSADFRAALYNSEQNVLNAVSTVTRMPGDVACQVKVICRKAGKPFVVDEFKMEELVKTERATNDDVAAMLRRQHITPFTTPARTSGEADDSISRWWSRTRRPN